MPVIWAAAIGAGAGLIGGAMSSSQSESNTASTNATSIDLANTSYQRRIADLKAAGLSPTLAYSAGGAAVPSLSTAQIADYGREATSGASAGADVMQGSTSNDVQKAQLANIPKQGDLISAQTAAAQGSAASSAADAQLKTQQAAAVAHQNALTDSQVGNVQSQTLVNQNSAATALVQQDKLRSDIAVNNAQIAKIMQDAKGGQISNETAAKLQPLVIQAKSLENQANALKLPKAAAEATAWKAPLMQKYGGYIGPASDALGGVGRVGLGAIRIGVK